MTSTTRTLPAGAPARAAESVHHCEDDFHIEIGQQVESLNLLRDSVHGANVAAGWWNDLATGERKDRNVGELLCLVHSEVSEAMEGHRKGLQDDKLPHRPMIEVELADVLIRVFDLAGGLNLDLSGAVYEKLLFNRQRPDHKAEIRKLAGGKAF